MIKKEILETPVEHAYSQMGIEVTEEQLWKQWEAETRAKAPRWVDFSEQEVNGWREEE